MSGYEQYRQQRAAENRDAAYAMTPPEQGQNIDQAYYEQGEFLNWLHERLDEALQTLPSDSFYGRTNSARYRLETLKNELLARHLGLSVGLRALRS